MYSLKKYLIIWPGGEIDSKFTEYYEAEISSFWDWMGEYMKPFIAEHEAHAQFYKDLAFDGQEIKNIQFVDLALTSKVEGEEWSGGLVSSG